MPDREQTRNVVDRRAEIIAVAHFGRTGMHRHPHADVGSLGPTLGRERALRVERGGDGAGRRGERRAECVADGLEDAAAMGLDRLSQQRIMLRECDAHRVVLRLP
jgi:hypothetical protein